MRQKYISCCVSHIEPPLLLARWMSYPYTFHDLNPLYYSHLIEEANSFPSDAHYILTLEGANSLPQAIHLRSAFEVLILS